MPLDRDCRLREVQCDIFGLPGEEHVCAGLW